MSYVRYGFNVQFELAEGGFLNSGRSDRSGQEMTEGSPSNFQLHAKNYDSDRYIDFSGNFGADTLDCRGNFRILRRTTVPNTQVAMADYNHTSEQGRLTFGTSWKHAQDWETFIMFNADNYGDKGRISFGSRVILRNLRKGANNSFYRYFEENWGMIATAATQAGTMGKKGPGFDAKYSDGISNARNEDSERKKALANARRFVAPHPYDRAVFGGFVHEPEKAQVFIIRPGTAA